MVQLEGASHSNLRQVEAKCTKERHAISALMTLSRAPALSEPAYETTIIWTTSTEALT